jgi:SAM-dependent methyltransferase
MSAPLDQVLAEQRLYYRARAEEYEDWWFRRGRYAHGTEADAIWFAEAARLREAIDRLAPGGRVLELACGTGLWTERLAEHASSVSALDSSPEVLALAREKVRAANVSFAQADLFAWEPEERYDVCFFSFWLSHVPAELRGAFWAKVAGALAPGGRVVLIDSARSPRASARDHELGDPREQLARRRLADGREYTIVKHWFSAPELAELIAGEGWSARIETTGEFFVYGEATPPVATSSRGS